VLAFQKKENHPENLPIWKTVTGGPLTGTRKPRDGPEGQRHIGIKVAVNAAR